MCRLSGNQEAGNEDEKEDDSDSDAFKEQLHSPAPSLSLPPSLPVVSPACQDWLDTFEDPDLRAAASDPDKWKGIMRENARLMYGSADEKNKDEL